MTVAEAQVLYDGSDSVHDFDHILRVLALAEHIAHVEGANLEIVRAAALLHDWGRAVSQADGSDHAAVAAGRARDHLLRKGVPETDTMAIAHAIAAHRFRSVPDPETLEAQVLFDADKLDAIGAIGIARAFAYSGAHGQRLWAPRRAVDLARWDQVGRRHRVDDDPDEHTAVHEFVVKLSRIKDRLYTAEGRRLAEGRHQAMVAFFDRLDAEVAGVL
ncbi:MAG: HD domain-containing protein [Anaerolineae bacterium]|nr:HD domain-containing protein [Anaerolineae bacterium]